MLEVEDYRLEKTGKSTIATFTVHLINAKMRIRKCKLLRLKNGHLKVVLPSYSEVPFSQRSPDDPLVFKQYVEFTSEKQKDFEEKTLEALNHQGLIDPESSTPQPVDPPF